MALDLDQVKRVARLARLAITDAEAAAARDQLNDIFALIETMQAVDTTGIVPMSHPQEFELRLRDDVVTETDQHALFQTIAPHVEADLYLVPKVLE